MKRMLQTILASVVMLSALPMLGVSPATMRSIFVDVSKKGQAAVEKQIEAFKKQKVAEIMIAQAIVAAQGLKVMDMKQKLELEKAALSKINHSYTVEANKAVAPLKKLADDLSKLLKKKSAKVTDKVTVLKKALKDAEEKKPAEEWAGVDNMLKKNIDDVDEIDNEKKDIKNEENVIKNDVNIPVDKNEEKKNEKIDLNEKKDLENIIIKKDEIYKKKEEAKPEEEIEIEEKIDFSTVENLIKNAGKITCVSDVQGKSYTAEQIKQIENALEINDTDVKNSVIKELEASEAI